MTTPYTAVVFTNLRTTDDADGYDAAAARMEELAAEQPGYLGIESVRGSDGVGITVSYWETYAHALTWKRHTEHLAIQQRGRDRWYEWYRVRVATVEREYSYDRAHVSRDRGTAGDHHDDHDDDHHDDHHDDHDDDHDAGGAGA